MEPLDDELKLPLEATPSLSAARMEELRAALVAEATRGPRRRRRRLALASMAAIFVVAAGSGLAMAITNVNPSEPVYRAFCYPNLDVSRGDSWTGTEMQSVSSGFAREQLDPVEACRLAWQAAAVWDPSTPRPTTTDNPVPPVTACILQDGDIAVFPGRAGVCQSLHLSDWGVK